MVLVAVQKLPPPPPWGPMCPRILNGDHNEEGVRIEQTLRQLDINGVMFDTLYYTWRSKKKSIFSTVNGALVDCESRKVAEKGL